MAQTDDFPAGTYGELTLNTPFHAVFEFCPDVGQTVDFEQDQFRFPAIRGRMYEILGTVDSGSIEVSFEGSYSYDPVLLSRPGHPNGTNPATARYVIQAGLNTVYFQANNLGTGTSDQNYTLLARQYEIPEGPTTLVRAKLAAALTGIIETPRDRDSFAVELLEGFTYRFDLYGADSIFVAASLPDPFLRLYDRDYQLLRDDNDSGNGRDSSFAYVAPYSGTYYMTAAGLLDNVGEYRISHRFIAAPDDYSQDTKTTGQIQVKPDSQIAWLDGTLEQNFDINWLRVEMVAGRWYQIASVYQDNAGSAAPDTRIVNPNFERMAKPTYFQAQQTGSHYIELVGPLGNTGPYNARYTVFIVDNAVPKPSTAYPYTSTLFTDQSRTLDRLFWEHGFPTEQVQVVSEADFHIGSTTFPRYQLHSFSANQISNMTFNAATPGTEYDVNLRLLGGGTSSAWVQSTIETFHDTDPILNIDQFWNATNTQNQNRDVITFRFANQVPSYFAPGRFTGFQAVSPQVKTVFENLFADENLLTGGPGLESKLGLSFEFDESENADIQIFTADANSYAVGYWPGTAGLGDIVLDNNFYSGSAEALPGSKAYFEILKAVASSLGVKHFAPELTREESVVGLKWSDQTGKPYPETLGSYDVAFLRERYGGGFSGDPEAAYRLGDNDRPFVKTIHNVDGYRQQSISAVNSNRPASIDLRRTRTSYLMGSGVWQSYTVSIDDVIPHATGSIHDDIITGNHRDNSLDGGPGNDILAGLGGNDYLVGNHGNDTYRMDVGDGNDTIVEFGSTRAVGGIDTLEIKAKLGMSSLEDDLTFKRLGNDLVVQLNMNGVFNRESAQVTIKNMNDPGAQIEKLDLQNYANQLGVYSLVSIWNAAIPGKVQRFTPTGSSDAFGLTAAPLA